MLAARRVTAPFRFVRFSHYTVLGVSKTATPADIKSAWREKAKQLHPDKAASGDARAFREALDAYRVLKDPGQRELYDQEQQNPRGFHTGRTFHRHPHSSGTREAYSGQMVNQLPPWLVASTAAVFVLGMTVPITSDKKRGEGGRQHRMHSEMPSRPPRVDDFEPSVPAFQNPLTGQWERLPDGYDPPTPFALMDFMRKNQGSQRAVNPGFENPWTTNMGGKGDALRVRYVPQSDAVDPILVHDRQTGKVIKYKAGTMEVQPNGAGLIPERRETVSEKPESPSEKRRRARKAAEAAMLAIPTKDDSRPIQF
jgi:curved DNA-binding protein CbpA